MSRFGQFNFTPFKTLKNPKHILRCKDAPYSPARELFVAIIENEYTDMDYYLSAASGQSIYQESFEFDTH
jgi:hypothetical protein